MGIDTLDVGIVKVINFFVEPGYNKCEECVVSNGHALGFFDLKEYDRFHYRRDSTVPEKISL